MITINGLPLNLVQQLNQASLPEIEIIETMINHAEEYEYQSVEELWFEIKFRVAILHSSRKLDHSRVRVATFATSKCNEQFWKLTKNGAFHVRKDVQPTEAITDIFRNGNLYSFESATAVVIILYKATLEIVGQTLFNQYFTDLVLYDWHYDQDLELLTTKGNEFIFGDCIYIKNPEFDPHTPFCRGGYAIVMGQDKYYDHGIGIKQDKAIISHLNNHRKTNAQKSANILEQVTRPHFNSLFKNKQHSLSPKVSCKLLIAYLGKKIYIS
ncbi:hypothetical protein [Litchfieldia alkalitelluris]|uniref:hypothetical protein n=1 Tax=Litchfieldia alkalitelluris TaxID=304268 RepID=UPI0009969C83|nr:hypothetical protein [Litchfieldia alkalitelluris]